MPVYTGSIIWRQQQRSLCTCDTASVCLPVGRSSRDSRGCDQGQPHLLSWIRGPKCRHEEVSLSMVQTWAAVKATACTGLCLDDCFDRLAAPLHRAGAHDLVQRPPVPLATVA